MRTCIYCRKPKVETDFSFEHVFPQCIGGALVPDEFKTRDVCKSCNNNLGLFVDASFEKSWFVSQQLQFNAKAHFDPLNPKGLPLVCMGPCDLKVPGMLETELCESWLGPFGEQVYWVRPRDDNLFWYGGGNPRTTKSIESRAYFMFSVNSSKNSELTWLSFANSFSKRRVKKIMCTQVIGANPKDIGFSDSDSLDIERVDYFIEHCATDPSRHISLAFYAKYDLRFMAKLAIGISHCLYGEKIASGAYSDELHKALWHRPDDELPLINGTTSFSSEVDSKFAQLTGFAGAVVLIISQTHNSTAINLNLGPRLNWTIKIAEHSDAPPEIKEQVIIVFNEIGKCFRMSLQNFVAIKIGRLTHAEMDLIAKNIQASSDYFSELVKV